MSERVWTAAFAAVVLAASSLLVPAGAGADDLSKKVNEAKSLDELRASDAELTQALQALDTDVARQQASVAAAQQAVEAATSTLNVHEAALADAVARIGELEGRAAERAIEEYMRPHDDVIGAMLAADGFSDASRRTAILQEVNGRDHDAIDELKAARLDLQDKRKAAIEAQRVANERKAAEQAKLDELNAARAEKAKLDQHLQERMETYAAEDEAGAAAIGGGAVGRADRGGSSEDDSRISAAGMRWPIQGPLRSPFGPRWGRQHTGIDVGGREGAPMYAAKGGLVTSAGYDGSGYGNMVRISHGGGVETWYAHQSRVAVQVGQTVDTGELIGYVGHTGRVVPNNASAAHLHFEVRVGGSPRNPMQYLP